MANAQDTTFGVGGVGHDASPRHRPAHCKTLGGAISKTAVNGIIDCLDPGGFGAVTITKSIQIDCDAGPGGILPGVTNGIVITGGAITVPIPNLNKNGVHQGLNGILINKSAQGT